jgi:ferritin-like metal-binding protein YciE
MPLSKVSPAVRERKGEETNRRVGRIDESAKRMHAGEPLDGKCGGIMKMLIEKLPDLQALYVKELRLFLSAEEMIAIKAPLMAETAIDPELIQLFREHISEMHRHADRLRGILNRASGEADPLKCKVVYSMFDELEGIVEDASHVPVRDAALISEAQRIEHYEMAGYSTLRQLACALELGQDAQLLDQSFREKERANQELALMAERIYPAARKAAYNNVPV